MAHRSHANIAFTERSLRELCAHAPDTGMMVVVAIVIVVVVAVVVVDSPIDNVVQWLSQNVHSKVYWLFSAACACLCVCLSVSTQYWMHAAAFALIGIRLTTKMRSQSSAESEIWFDLSIKWHRQQLQQSIQSGIDSIGSICSNDSIDSHSKMMAFKKVDSELATHHNNEWMRFVRMQFIGIEFVMLTEAHLICTRIPRYPAS